MAEFESIRIGDIVRDMNPTWINYGCKGVVTSINGDYVTWVKDDTGEELTDHHSDLEVVTSMQEGGRGGGWGGNGDGNGDDVDDDDDVIDGLDDGWRLYMCSPWTLQLTD